MKPKRVVALVFMVLFEVGCFLEGRKEVPSAPPENLFIMNV